MSDLRVAQFLPHFPSLEGTSAYVCGLSRAMDRIWPGACPVVSFRSDGRPAPRGVSVVSFPKHSGSVFHLPRELHEWLDTNPLDAMVLHGVYNPPNASLAKELVSRDIPYIFVPHDPYVRELTGHRFLRKQCYWHLFEKRMIREAAAVQLLDESHEPPLRKLGISTPVFTVPNGCDPDSLNDSKVKLVVPGKRERVRVQYLGRMDRNHKGLDLAIKGFAQFLRSGIPGAEDFDLILTGNDWEDLASLERLSLRLGLGNRVHFTGPSDMPSLGIHGQADLVILPSRFDGFGLTIVEAMLAARPVLVSNRAGVAGHVHKAGGGIVFEPEPNAIAEALEQAVSRRDQWESMGRMNQDYVRCKLTWEQVARRTMEGYRRFLGG